VAELRRRKARDDKPFALLVADVDTARTLVDLDEVAAQVLGSVGDRSCSPRGRRTAVSLRPSHRACRSSA
jgi:hypothetical protein